MAGRSARTVACAFAWVVALMLICLAACGNRDAAGVYDVERSGKVYTVDEVQRTITVDGHVCRYQIRGSGDNVYFEVTYPDGSTYWWQESGSTGYGGWSDDYSPQTYVAGELLWDILNLNHDTGDAGRFVVLGLLLIVLGAIHVAVPRIMWQLVYGWRYRHAQPSRVALAAQRVMGAIVMIVGAICLFI